MKEEKWRKNKDTSRKKSRTSRYRQTYRRAGRQADTESYVNQKQVNISNYRLFANPFFAYDRFDCLSMLMSVRVRLHCCMCLCVCLYKSICCVFDCVPVCLPLSHRLPYMCSLCPCLGCIGAFLG